MKTYEQARTAPTDRGPENHPVDEELLAFDPESAGAAHAFLVSTSTRWGCAERLDEALVCVSALGTNAVLNAAPLRGSER